MWIWLKSWHERGSIIGIARLYIMCLVIVVLTHKQFLSLRSVARSNRALIQQSQLLGIRCIFAGHVHTLRVSVSTTSMPAQMPRQTVEICIRLRRFQTVLSDHWMNRALLIECWWLLETEEKQTYVLHKSCSDFASMLFAIFFCISLVAKKPERIQYV